MFGWTKKVDVPEVEDLGVGATEFGSTYTSRTAQHLKDNRGASKTDSASDDGVNNVYLTSDLVHKCVDYLASNVSQVRFKVKQTNKSTGKIEPVKDKKLESLFNTSPNEYQTWGDLLYIDTLATQLTGNSYLTFEKVKGKYEMWAINNPQDMEIEIDEVDGLISGYKFGREIEYDRNEIIHNKLSVLGNSYYGASPITSLVDSLTLEGYGTQDLIKFYENGLVGSSILSSEQPLTKKQATDLTAEMSNKYGMKNGKRHSLIVLPNNLTVKPLRLNPREAMLLDSLEIAQDRVLSTFKLHKMVLGGSIESYTRGIDELVNLQFTNAIRPIIHRIKENIEAFLRRTLKNDYLVLEVDYSYLPEVKLAKLAHQDIARNLYVSGLCSLNEAREILGLPAIDVELADQNHLPSFLVGSDLHTIQNLTPEIVDKIRQANQEGAPKNTQEIKTDKLGGKNKGKEDKVE